MGTGQPRLTADTVESPLPGNRHGGFGERPGETDREQSRHRAPGRLNAINDQLVDVTGWARKRRNGSVELAMINNRVAMTAWLSGLALTD